VKGAILRRFTPEVMGRVYPNKLLSLQDSELEQEIEQVSRQRSVALAQHKHNVTGSTSLRMGRLLYFAPGLSIFDGAAMVVSGGFFDEETFPPSDTWIAYLKEKTDHKGHPPGYLLSWVPEQVINLVEDAIVVDPTESIRWAASVNTPFLDLLRQQNPKLAGV